MVKNSVSTRPTRVRSDGSFHPADCDLGRVLIDSLSALALGLEEEEDLGWSRRKLMMIYTLETKKVAFLS